MGTLTAPGAWSGRPDLACRAADPELFFDDGRGGSPLTEAARNICRSCPGYEDCRLYAITQPPHLLYGVWGATTQAERLARAAA